MDSFEWNKIFMAVLGSVLILLFVREISAMVYHVDSPKTPAYTVAVLEDASGPKVEKPKVDFAALIVEANVAKGKNAAEACIGCHTFEQGAPNGSGPNLWDIVGKPVASVAGFGGYSSGAGSLAATGGVWDYEKLNNFLLAPKKYAPRTSMAYSGIKRDKKRADVIAYLRSLSDNPVPLPVPATAEETPEAPAIPTEG